jgi:hypothetical protein
MLKAFILSNLIFVSVMSIFIGLALAKSPDNVESIIGSIVGLCGLILAPATIRACQLGAFDNGY